MSLRPKILDCPGLKWLARLLLLLTLLAQPQLSALARRPSDQLQAGLAGEKSPPQPIEHGHGHRNLDLDRRIEKILDRSDAQRGSLGIQVVEVGTGKVLHEREADHLFIPASNVKMFTTAAALEKLGPGYVFHTTLEIDAAPDVEGRVGDLYLVGRGDPNLGARIFPYVYHGPQQPADTFVQEMADQVQAHGVREVTGRLVADDTYFVWEPFAPNWNADDLEFGYGAPVTALAFNDNSLTLAVKPAGKVGDPASVSLSPVPDYYLLKNHILTSARGSEKNHHLERQPGSMELDLWGQLPIDGGDDTDTLAISNPPQLLAEQLAAALRARGIVVDGAVEVRHITRLEASSPASASPVPPRIILADHTSPPLAEAIKVVNKESENLHAEMLLRTLGRVLNNQGSLEAGLAALNSFATQQVGILPGETYFSDGSGLSREDLVAPQAAVKLLLYMTSSPNYQAFFKSLPVSGIDGTLIHRLLSDEVKGRIHAKTGSVEHVNTLSGYMDLPSGKRLAFSIMLNNHPLSTEDGQETLDAIAVAIFKHYAKHPG